MLRSSPVRLLLVDDQPEMRRLCEVVLRAEGFVVTSAASAADARALLRESLPDAVLLDLCMPGTDGHSLAVALGADPRTQGLPIILLTAAAPPPQLLPSIVGVITKPFRPTELAEQVQALLASRS